jgi:hypothetical protein
VLSFVKLTSKFVTQIDGKFVDVILIFLSNLDFLSTEIKYRSDFKIKFDVSATAVTSISYHAASWWAK